MAAQETLLNGRYRLIAQQGSGGMAVVYKAQDMALGRTVAIKILRPSLTSDGQFLTRFRQEARNVANLQHPNIVTVHDVGQDGNTYYMVMEYIDGQDLKKLIRAGAPFPVERTLHISIQVCAGLGYAHRAGLVHADVKPQNILLMGNDIVKITDFGIAQALSHTQPQEKQKVVWGSPHYFSPEQASGELPTPASDVYAIGIVMFEMLTGQLPYNGTDQQELALAHLREQIPHVRDLNKNVPANVDWIVHKIMSKEPANRYRTADQLGRILISYQKQGQEPASAQPPAAAPAPSPITPAVQSPPPPAIPLPASPPRSTASASPGFGNTPPPQPPYTPPPQISPIPPYQPGTGSMNRVSSGVTPPEPVRPITSSYLPPDGSTGMRTGGPSYQYAQAAPTVDFLTIVLGIVAFLAVFGLIILWLAVLAAYGR